MYLKGIKACCAQAFAAVLAIPCEIIEEQCLKRISDLVRSRTALLRLGRDNRWRSNPLAALVIARGGTFQGAAKFSHRL